MPTLLVFLKYPVAGQVKTRLAGSIGAEEAAGLYRQWIGLVLQNVQATRNTTRLVACYDGAHLEAFEAWHALADEWWRQPEGGLGDRLDAAFQHWQSKQHPAVAIGTDCIDIDASCIAAAFASLLESDAVFGPATDGGYYLVGLARYLPGFFQDIPWSTPQTLAAHQERCRQHSWSYGLLPVLRDIDTAEDWFEHQRRGSEPV